jgi:hypothetical protein
MSATLPVRPGSFSLWPNDPSPIWIGSVASSSGIDRSGEPGKSLPSAWEFCDCTKPPASHGVRTGVIATVAITGIILRQAQDKCRVNNCSHPHGHVRRLHNYSDPPRRGSASARASIENMWTPEGRLNGAGARFWTEVYLSTTSSVFGEGKRHDLSGWRST